MSEKTPEYYGFSMKMYSEKADTSSEIDIYGCRFPVVTTCYLPEGYWSLMLPQQLTTPEQKYKEL